MQYNYEWDRLKAKLNLSKHGVDFKEACKVFDDPMAITLFDDEESTPEEDLYDFHLFTIGIPTYRNGIRVVLDNPHVGVQKLKVEYFKIASGTCIAQNGNATT